MSEGDKQAPISSGWWYDLNLSFCISLLSAAGCRVTHALVAGVKRDFLLLLLATQNTATFSLTCFWTSEAACGHFFSRLLTLLFFECCVKVLIWIFRWIVEQLLNCCWKNLCMCVCFHDFSSRSSGVFICSCVAMKLTRRFAKKIIHYS